jgi:hypothetical protein
METEHLLLSSHTEGRLLDVQTDDAPSRGDKRTA